jgi:hypothetical protein
MSYVCQYEQRNSPLFYGYYEPGTKPVLEASLKTQCVDFIRPKNTIWKQTWIRHLDDDSLNACMAVLLAMLPNLHTLYMGADSIAEYPMFRGFVGTWGFGREEEDNQPLRDHGNLLWPHLYLEEIFGGLLSHLHMLELPCDWDTSEKVHHYLKKRMCTQELRQLALPLEAAFGPWYANTVQESIASSFNIIPPTVEVLVFTSVGTYKPEPVVHSNTVLFGPATSLFLREEEPIETVLHGIVDNKGAFPNLRRIEIYCAHETMKDLTGLSEVVTEAGIALYIRRRTTSRTLFTCFTHGQAWRYTESELRQLEIIPTKEWFVTCACVLAGCFVFAMIVYFLIGCVRAFERTEELRLVNDPSEAILLLRSCYDNRVCREEFAARGWLEGDIGLPLVTGQGTYR